MAANRAPKSGFAAEAQHKVRPLVSYRDMSPAEIAIVGDSYCYLIGIF